MCLPQLWRPRVAGPGSVVVVSGEAGIGKTSLVRYFLANAGARARVIGGACDDLISPRPLGPLRDAAAAGGGPLSTAIAGWNRDDLLIAVRDELADGPRPTVLVIDDVDWADDATLDVLSYLSADQRSPGDAVDQLTGGRGGVVTIQHGG